MPIFQEQTDPFRMHMLSNTAPCAEAVFRGSPAIKDRFNRYPEFHASLPFYQGNWQPTALAPPSSFHSPIGLSIVVDRPRSAGPITLIVDSTGLRIHRGSGWQEVKHETRKPRKSGRKLHIRYDPDSGEIIASLLTTDQVGDETALPERVAGIEAPVARVLADGAYDGSRVSNCLTQNFGPDVEITIPPPKTAVLGRGDQRDTHIRSIAGRGRMAWQTATGYNNRALVEARIGRRKLVIGPGLNAREMNRQITENQIATKFLNRMTRTGRAAFKRVA